MLWVTLAILLILWLAGLASGVGGAAIHVLLGLAVIVLAGQLVSGRQTRS